MPARSPSRSLAPMMGPSPWRTRTARRRTRPVTTDVITNDTDVDRHRRADPRKWFGGDRVDDAGIRQLGHHRKHRFGEPERQLDYVRPGQRLTTSWRLGETATVVTTATPRSTMTRPSSPARTAHDHDYWTNDGPVAVADTNSTTENAAVTTTSLPMTRTWTSATC